MHIFPYVLVFVLNKSVRHKFGCGVSPLVRQNWLVFQKILVFGTLYFIKLCTFFVSFEYVGFGLKI